jgi:hypothetical protein
MLRRAWGVEVTQMATSIEITVPANEDVDDCLTAAAASYFAAHPELKGWDLSARWTDDTRESVTLTVPAWSLKSLDVTDEVIQQLRTEAGENGDTTLVRTCSRALNGDTEAFRTVLQVLHDAAAQDDDRS